MSSIQFTPDLSALQGVIISADYQYSFKDLSAKGGNEKEIESVIHTIRNFLKSQSYLTKMGVAKDSNDTMRRNALYIVLNSDLDVLNELISTHSTIDLLIWTVPTIPKCLMCEMLWNLCMEKFLKEIITFSYPRLAVEVADAHISHLKYMNPTECLKQLHLLSTACFNILCRIHFFDYEENCLNSALNNFQRCMTYFCKPPNESKLEILTKDDLYKYYGSCLHTMLTIVLECFTQYNSIHTQHLPDSVAVYQVTYSDKCTKRSDFVPSKCTNKMIAETLNKSLADLLDTCMKLVMGINLDIFCAWSEFEEDGVTMQESVGELSYKVRHELLNSEACEHAVVSMLEQISRKPVNIMEVINKTETSVIIENIKKNKNDSVQWLQALAHRDNLLQDLALLQILETNLDKLSEDNCYEMVQKLYNDCNGCTNNNKQLIQILIIKLFQRCNKASKYDIVDTHFKDGYFNNNMECTEFIDMITQFINKLAISPDSDLSDVLNMFIQNPRQVYVTIFKSSIENKQQADLMFKVMTYLVKYSNHCYSDETEPCLVITVKNALGDEDVNTDAKQDNLLNFISEFKNNDIIPATKLLLLIIMPKLHASLISKNYRIIYLLCKLLHKSYSVENLLEYRTPMLAMLAQVMAQVRWKINTFDILGPTILSLAIEIQTSLMTSYDRTISANEVSWLKRKVKELDPLNMYYYRQLWNPPGNTFVEVVSGIHIHMNMDTELLTLWLAQVLCSSTMQEWDDIWDSLKVFGDPTILDLFHCAMMSVLTAEKCHRTNTTWACMLYCYKNLFHCIRYKFFKLPLSSSQVSNVADKLLAIICGIEEDYIEHFGELVLPIFAFIAERKRDYNINISQAIESNLSQSKLYNMIHNLFTNGSS